MTHADELEAIRRRYTRRDNVRSDRYSLFNPDVLARVHERRRATAMLLRSRGVSSLWDKDILEVGCGGGSNLVELLEFGANPSRLIGNELIDERIQRARSVLPGAIRLLPGDASVLPFGDNAFDIILQSTVFSSILDDELQVRLAVEMWRWLRPGGAVLWYDFTVDNPFNRDVRGVSMWRVRSLFPAAQIAKRRVSLAPPIARAVVRIHPSLYGVANLLPFLRTHVVCWIQKQ